MPGAFELTYDPQKWKAQPAGDADGVSLLHVSGDARLTVIVQRLAVERAHLTDVALTSARRAAPDVRVASESWRTVNGLRTLLLRLDGVANGSPYSCYTQLYSDDAGTVQLVVRAGSSRFDDYRVDALELLAGFRKVRGPRPAIRGQILN